VTDTWHWQTAGWQLLFSSYFIGFRSFYHGQSIQLTNNGVMQLTINVSEPKPPFTDDDF
jgi:hypothetical protein